MGIKHVVAGILPENKEAAVLEAQAQSAGVAMVGDGLNDAPALARADVGIAMGGGTEVALEAGDITLVGGELSGVAKSVRLSRATMRTIKQNLFWAFFYNLILVPVAAGALYPLTFLPGFIRELHRPWLRPPWRSVPSPWFPTACAWDAARYNPRLK